MAVAVAARDGNNLVVFARGGNKQGNPKASLIFYSPSIMSMETGVPTFLLSRGLPDEYAGKRWIDNEEVALLSILDDSGKVSTTDSLVHLMCFMTKMTKVLSY